MKRYPQRLRHSSGQTMVLQRDRILLAFRKAPAAAKGVAQWLSGLGLELEDVAQPLAAAKGGRPFERINHTKDRVWVRTAGGEPIGLDLLERLRHENDPAVEWVGPVYELTVRGRSELLSPLPHALLVKAAPGADAKLAKHLEGRGLAEVPERSKYLRPFRYFVVKNPWEAPAHEVRAALLKDERDVVADVRLETMPMAVPTALEPNDTLYANQWNMARIQAGGAGQTAWNYTTGAANVVVCILDEGVDLTHPDLQFAGQGINLGTMAPTGAPTGDHGTACAGIAAATVGNGQGVAGVAGGCRILPVAVDAWTDAQVAAGIQWAAANGARVISMSFGWDAWDHAVIDPAIQAAFNANVVMCAATHNHNGDITYPATNPLVIAVGASDENDDRKSPTSPDGETWWGSDFGPEISVVAPGVHIPTTDRQGADGYNTSAGTAGDYFMTFNGTSAATPHVAGLAALLISSDPGLSNVDVRDIIEQNADKVGTVPYASDPDHPNGTWNEEMGYGRINAYRAVRSIAKGLAKELKDSIADKHLKAEKPFRIEKSLRIEKPAALEKLVALEKHGGLKEKERIDEVKALVGYEVPEFDPGIYERLVERLERLEQAVHAGKPFIRASERPEVGKPVGRRAKKTR